MRCEICNKLSFYALCKDCRAALAPFGMRYNIDGLHLFTFYKYDEIEPLVKKKYDKFGDRALRELAALCITPFFKALDLSATLVPIDDTPRAFSHTAILARAARSKRVKISYATLIATANVQYAGKDLALRRANSKNFVLKKPISGDVILIDDVVTTGTTMAQAVRVLESAGANVLFAVSLCRLD
ncbi:MAG: ComF family protein [Helicobacteraceae bacterium]